MSQLAGKVAIVTGAARGLGRAYAEAMAREGAAIFACDINSCDDTVAAIEAAGGRGVACGWLEDKYGFSWQIVPREYVKLLRSKDKKKVVAMNAVMMEMVKLDMGALRKAYNGKKV